MIVRVIEYVIQCDHPDCMDSCAYGSHASRGGASDAKKDCAESAKADGWKEAGGGRWLCPRCAKLAERAARPRLLVDEIAMGLHHD